MKTAVSIPDEVYKRAEKLARQTKRSRSRLFSDALGEYLERHESDEISEAMNAVVAEVGESVDPFVSAASNRNLERTDW
jgi:predicted transcriptional regulator